MKTGALTAALPTLTSATLTSATVNPHRLCLPLCIRVRP